MTVQELVELLDDFGDQVPVIVKVDGTDYEIIGTGGTADGKCVILTA